MIRDLIQRELLRLRERLGEAVHGRNHAAIAELAETIRELTIELKAYNAALSGGVCIAREEGVRALADVVAGQVRREPPPRY